MTPPTDLVRRIWARDPRVWTDDPAQQAEIAQRLGWLTLPTDMQSAVPRLTAFADQARARFRRVVLIGMGGSSLAPEVIWRTFGQRPGFPALALMDSTDPDAVHAVTHARPAPESLFIVASKSGSTVETDALFRHFWALAPRGDQFVAITDPGSPLAALAGDHGFAHTFLNPPEVGGRYSALSYFGLVPAALVGVDLGRLLERARDVATACGPEGPADQNPGYRLGEMLAGAATVSMPDPGGFGLWVEQLVAESTGKDGKGVLPVPDEPAVMKLADRHDLGAEFFRWEFATAVAGAVLRVNPFDQPNVAESKQNTATILAQVEGRGARFETPPALTKEATRRWMEAAAKSSYVAVLAYAPPTEGNDHHLAEMRRLLRDRLGVPATTGYGPRYLHSTGQYHKGGPPTGAFLLITTEHRHDLDVPGHGYTFGTLQEAQALGDWEALHRRQRPVLRMHLGEREADLAPAVERIRKAV